MHEACLIQLYGYYKLNVFKNSGLRWPNEININERGAIKLAGMKGVKHNIAANTECCGQVQ
jgi:hypothetical protein